MFKDKKIIIFDLDGTLIDSIDIWNQVDVELVKRISGKSIKFSEIENLRDTIMMNCKPNEDKCLKYFEGLKIKYNSHLTPKEISKLNDEIALELLETVIDYKKGAAELIKKLKPNFKLIIATTSPKYMVDIYINKNKNIINKANIKKYFEGIYTKESVNSLKPDSEIYLKILKDYNVSPEECLVFEDSIEGIRASKKAGIKVVAVYDKYSDKYRKIIDEESDYQIKSFTDLLD